MFTAKACMAPHCVTGKAAGGTSQYMSAFLHGDDVMCLVSSGQCGLDVWQALL